MEAWCRGYISATYPGRGIDESADFGEWSMDQLRQRVRLVQGFDSLCDAVVADFLWHCDYAIIEKDIMVPKTVRVLEPLSA